MNFVRRPQSFVISPFSARVASGARFGTFLGSGFGAFWRSRWLTIPLGAAKSRSRLLLFGPGSTPRGFQERPISPWKPPLSRPSLFNSSNTPPRGLQDASRASLGPLGASPRLLQEPPRAPERHPRTPRRDLPEASASKPPSIQDLSLCFYALLGQGPSVHHPRPGGMREAIE